MGVPFGIVTGPSGSPASFTWNCINDGQVVQCNAPYNAPTTTTSCVAFDPLNREHSSLVQGTAIVPTGDDMALVFNNPDTSLPNNTVQDGIRYLDGMSYSFSGVLDANHYMNVTINNLHIEPSQQRNYYTPQFVQYRKLPTNSLISDIDIVPEVGGRSESGRVIAPNENVAKPFYGCRPKDWGYSDPLTWVNNNIYANIGKQADDTDPLRGWIDPVSHPLHNTSAFLAWGKMWRGFSVDCQVCTTTTVPAYPITRDAACTDIPAHALYNTVSTITQTQVSSGAAWLPSNVSVYNTTASSTECRFVCESGYNWNGSACIANTQTASCPSLTVANATSNGSTTWTQTRGAGGWNPNYTWTYTTTPGICTFACNSGYNWNGSACVQATTYTWDIGLWSACANNEQTRSVVCKSNNGTIVADNLCPQPKPATSQVASCPTSGPVCGAATVQNVHPVCYNGSF